MWWRVALAAFSGLIALGMAALYTGIVSVRITMDAGKIPARAPLILGQPLMFYVAVVIIVVAAMPLAIRLLRGRPGPKP